MIPTFRILIRYILLVIIMFILWITCISAATAVVGYQEPPMSDEAAGEVLATMLLVCAVNTAVLTYAIMRSRWHGFRLVGVIALQIFGIQFFISQIETSYFNDAVQMPEDLILAIVIGGFFLAMIFSFLAVLILGKMKKQELAEEAQPTIPRKEFAIKGLLLAALVYPMVYGVAGYWIAWQFEDVRLLYTGSTHLAGFGDQLITEFLQSWLYPYQILRGVMWVLIALPVIRMLRGGGWEKAIVVALLLSCLMSMQLLLPNPYMPGDVRCAHFLETFSSNALWGLLVAWLMHRHHSSPREFLPF